MNDIEKADLSQLNIDDTDVAFGDLYTRRSIKL